jgi:hypothetical protein
MGMALLLLLAGGGAIYLLYGAEATLGALACLTFMLLPVGLIALWLWGMDRIVGKARDG